jgi:hypothetical protein
MADILPFKRPKVAHKHRGNTLCRHGFHSWRLDTARKFDVKRGRLVTVYRCSRCGSERIQAQ